MKIGWNWLKLVKIARRWNFVAVLLAGEFEGGKLQESVKKRKEVKDWEDGHPKMSPNQLSRKEKIQMKLAE